MGTRLIRSALFLLLITGPTLVWAADPSAVFTIEVEGEAKRSAVKVVPRADGTVVVTAPDGRIEYLSAQRIRSIVDADGEDWTIPVLRDRERLPSSKRRSSPKWKALRLRPGPLEECGSYLITESSILRRVGSTGAGLGNGYVVMEYGYARNIRHSFSVGGTAFLGITEENSKAGFRLRLVKWLNKDISFNLSPGIVATGSENDGLDEFLGPGFTLQAAVAARGMVGLTLETHTVGRMEWHNSSAGPPEEVHETFTSLGIRFGGLPGLIAAPPTFFVGLLMSLRE